MGNNYIIIKVENNARWDKKIYNKIEFLNYIKFFKLNSGVFNRIDYGKIYYHLNSFGKFLLINIMDIEKLLNNYNVMIGDSDIENIVNDVKVEIRNIELKKIL